MQTATAIITLLKAIPPTERIKVVEWIDKHRKEIGKENISSFDYKFVETVANDTLKDIWDNPEEDIWDKLYTKTND